MVFKHWRVAKSLLVLRGQVSFRWPLRSKISDGTIGDPAHSSRVSDHNPNEAGVVCALDITNDPVHGPDARKLADLLKAKKDKRIKYIISARRIAASYPVGAFPAWAWRDYHGINAHEHHVHISVKADLADDDSPWDLGAIPGPHTPEVPKSPVLPPMALAEAIPAEVPVLSAAPITAPNVPSLNPARAVQILTEKAKWARHWAAGAVGNLQRESYHDLRPWAAGDRMKNGKPDKAGEPTAFGIGQWRSGRKDALDQFAKSRGTTWSDFETQVLFVDHELLTTEKLANYWLRRAQTTEQACDAMIFYERPDGFNSIKAKEAKTWDDVRAVAEKCNGWSSRQKYAKAI